ncbi:MAG: ABC transporter permease [Bacillota bacterium]|nr:ABC transporter permease [Bacillota bacterium]
MLEIVKMHPCYTIPTNNIEISFSANEESDLNHKMEEGESYFVYGQYYDIALIHRIMYAGIINVPVEKLMDCYAPYTDQEIEEMTEIRRKLGIEDERPVGHIFNPETHGVVMTAQHLKDFHTYRFLVHGYVEISEKDQLKDILKSYDLTYSQLPVIGTDDIEKIFEFHLGELLISEGRRFAEGEYANGERVCIVSEMLAAANDYKVGDTIDLAFSLNRNHGYNGILNKDRPTPLAVLPLEVYGDTDFSPHETFQIVGFYRIKNIWDLDLFSFTPNTVFVPKKSIEADSMPLEPAVFSALEIKKGRTEEFKRLMGEAQVSEESLRIFDNGCEQIKKVIQSFRESAVWLLIASISV